MWASNSCAWSLTPSQMLDGVTAVMGFVIGVASDRGQDAERADGGTPPWEGLEAAEYPFLFAMRDQFLLHDDRAQFLAGLELILSGLRLQSGRA
ncbi:TetR/AcrR family transcriptional regulator C-terminal domain-containing protein [Demequina litorisediminis]|uniref:Tetracycline repressor TetR C-terminal domain-containing protein n=1 Tax=Demequina litorisediminis TaxID=1849022 RepID=A0ABQ6IC15_9MICO|nr:TetR/AcrR family transcriptional regulator C-terminal domain-containing protein [Demequina litorisediminis]GMA35320.1 hypothetical protein GCM10025876_15240 [Demequina litorisediminis]